MVTWAIILILAATANVYVYQPQELRNKVNERYRSVSIKASLANFGNPPYGRVITGRVFRPKEGQEEACTWLDTINFASGDPDGVISPILMINRGSCSFVVKARNAQNIGAAAVLFVNNDDSDVDSIIMIDDGTAGNIEIPSYLISKVDGELIGEYIYDMDLFNQGAALTLTFDIPHPDNRVEYSLWMSSAHWWTRSFLHDFAPWGMRFDDSTALMTPHYVLLECHSCKAKEYKEDHPDCLSGGRYCQFDPDGSDPLRGRDVVEEDLRQICIHQQTLELNNENLWWKYVKAFNETCTLANFGKGCSDTAMVRAGVDSLAVDKCVTESFNGNDPLIDDNDLLKRQRELLIDTGIIFYPMVIINNQTFKGDLEVDSVMRGICAGYITMPKVCHDFYKDLPATEDKEEQGLTMTIILLVIFVCIMLLILALVLYRLWLKRELNKEMRAQVDSAVSQYIALSESRH